MTGLGSGDSDVAVAVLDAHGGLRCRAMPADLARCRSGALILRSGRQVERAPFQGLGCLELAARLVEQQQAKAAPAGRLPRLDRAAVGVLGILLAARLVG